MNEQINKYIQQTLFFIPSFFSKVGLHVSARTSHASAPPPRAHAGFETKDGCTLVTAHGAYDLLVIADLGQKYHLHSYRNTLNNPLVIRAFLSLLS